MTKQTLSQAIARLLELPSMHLANEDEIRKVIVTQQRMIEGATNKLTKISKLRRTYNGLPCKNEAADIADEALKQLESEEME